MRIGFDTDVTRTNGLTAWQAQIDSMQRTFRRLSTGLRVNAAVDDAAGLAISQRMTSQIDGSRQAYRNIQEAVGFLDVADGALSRSVDVLQRIRVIALQSANGTYDSIQRASLQRAVDSAVREIDSVAENASYDMSTMLDGTRTSWTFQTGADAGDAFTVHLGGARATHLGLADTPPPPHVRPGPAPGGSTVTTPAGPPPSTTTTPPPGDATPPSDSTPVTATPPPTDPAPPSDTTPGTNPTAPTDPTPPADGGTVTPPADPVTAPVEQIITDWDVTVSGWKPKWGEAPSMISVEGTPKAGRYTTQNFAVYDQDKNWVGRVHASQQVVEFFEDGSKVSFDKSVYHGLSTNRVSFELTPVYGPAPSPELTPVPAVSTFAAQGPSPQVGDMTASLAASEAARLVRAQNMATMAAVQMDAAQTLLTAMETHLPATPDPSGQGDADSATTGSTSGTPGSSSTDGGANSASAVGPGAVSDPDTDAPGTGTWHRLSVTTQQDARDTVERVDRALEVLMEMRGRVGAATRVLGHRGDTALAAAENLGAARSRILDADVAVDAARLAKLRAVTDIGGEVLTRMLRSGRDVVDTILASAQRPDESGPSGRARRR